MAQARAPKIASHTLLTAFTLLATSVSSYAAAPAPFVVPASTPVLSGGGELASSSQDASTPQTRVSTSNYYVLSETTPAQPGVAGKIDVFSARDTFTETWLDHTQSLSVGVYLNGTDTVDFSYTITPSAGVSLINGGVGYLSAGFNGGFVAADSLLGAGSVAGTLKVTAGSSTLYNSSFSVGSLDDEATYISKGKSFTVDFDDSTPLVFSGQLTGTNFAWASGYGSGFNLYGYIQETLNYATNTTTQKTLLQSVVIPPLAVPEPETYALSLAGLGVALSLSRRRKVI
jgi:hypothetical protein